MKVKSESKVAQSCLTPSDPMDCSLLGSCVHGNFQARVLEWGARGRQGEKRQSSHKEIDLGKGEIETKLWSPAWFLAPYVFDSPGDINIW